MYDSHRPACRPVCGYGDALPPLRTLEESFLALAGNTHSPLTLPADLVCEEPQHRVMPVDQVRAHLAHPATDAELRRRTWREVVRRAQQLREPWDTVALAMTLPVLRRMLARLARPAALERADLEQEALAAVAAVLHTVDVDAEDVGRELFAAADRAVHRLVYAARRQAARETLGLEATAGRESDPVCGDMAEIAGEEADEFSVLARAVEAGIVDVGEARLIARTRLAGEPMSRLAVEGGISVRQLYRHRAAAEQHLAAYLHSEQRAKR